MQSVIDEVEALHLFFEQWFEGSVPATESEFERFTSVMDPDFVIVSPTGTLTPLEPLSESLRQAHGHWQSEDAIEIRNVVTRHRRSDTVIATYEEWQTRGEQTTGRLSSVVFAIDDEAPRGLRWLSVHETWLPDAAPR